MNTSAAGWVAVIDDDAAIRRALTRFFRAQGIRTEPYGSADEYVKHTRDDLFSLPACIVLDVQLLQGMSSFALIDRMDVEGTRVPVIFVTALLELQPDLCARYPELQVALRKPLDADRLIAR